MSSKGSTNQVEYTQVICGFRNLAVESVVLHEEAPHFWKKEAFFDTTRCRLPLTSQNLLSLPSPVSRRTQTTFHKQCFWCMQRNARLENMNCWS